MMKRNITQMLALLAICAIDSVAQQAFASAGEASESLFQAVTSNNVKAITNLLGGPTELASSSDEVQDKVDRDLFVQKYREMHRLRRDGDGSVTLYIGAENWPFPIPLVAKNGAWHFDPEAGSKEVMLRRIGENEMAAIATCHEFVAAERLRRANPNTSDPTASASNSLVARAASKSTGGDAVLLDGYYFRLLAALPKNGFALIAYPDKYRITGVMTLVVTQNGVVYEKDLGPNASALARAMRAFHRDSGWRAADE